MPRYEVNLSMLFTELPLLDRPKAAADAGFTAVEFWWPFAEAVPTDRAIDAFVTARHVAGGDRGLVSWPDRTTEFRHNIDVTVGIGEQLGCRAFNALYGNRIDGSSAQEQDDTATANLGAAARAAARIGGTVLVEPVSGAPHYPLRTAADCLDVIDRVHVEQSVTNLGFLCDLYHLSVNGDDVRAVIAEHGDLVAHVQVADAPGRGEPGTGELDLDGALAALAGVGYTGWVGLEYKPTTGDTLSSLAWLPREARAS